MASPFASGDWSTLRVGVLGLGRSGCGAAELLQTRGATVVGFDDRVAEAVEAPAGLELHLADAIGPPRDRSGLDALVVSPGVHPGHYVRIAAARAGIPVVGEIELAAIAMQGRIVAITGTNGKSTVASWLHHCLEVARRDAVLGGNIGVAASRVAPRVHAESVAVLEVSSFQLETIDTFHPRVAVLLNVAPDHLDRYEDLEAYAAAKRNILRNATGEDWFVAGSADAYGTRWADDTAARVLWFSDEDLEDDRDGAFVREGQLMLRRDGTEELVCAVQDLPLLGRHNVRNAGAVVCCATALGLDVRSLREGLLSFGGLPHRTQLVATLDGVRYVNDSKATNVHAAAASLAGLDGPVVILLGGRGKGEDYRPLRDHVGRVKVAVCYGEEGPSLADALAGACPTERAAGLAAAFARARELASPGDVVLLSPACASFDEFRSFEHRGDAFARLVRAEEAS